ncbi:FAD-dependent oxidoreductase [Lactobacillus pentosus]|jgi:fumarate reductase flavoprotein subunit|uniref:FAD-dependent oxidoreductase n=1 Tax=Lactiplantibacillus pentosus TaxID=1589 RepID=UPI00128CB5A1|nr:FAD-dependent oxidoreductase [Lactiplantibacillus pentosus]MCT3292967.1 FAD-dependent oxidoreductase [Lactiplantibacillus pentosus]MPQ17820.1 FAD-dependent oxidoreductase [Lactiplantibacillus pentosus]UXI97569.1 FAD-dependent oxidoreductase [Lactiplantibacillus pentosus]BBM21506.1 fumarate reductase/succinate dehydrogenase flavoprotein domain protein [Lactiplantibacillus plantarum]
MANQTINTDILVAGTGGTGLAAAYAAVTQGLNVTVIEKQAQIGGNTKISSGFFAINSREQQQAGLHVTTKEAIAQLADYNHYLSNGALLSRIVNSSADTLAWLEQMGMEIKLNPTSKTTQFAHRNNDYRGGSYHMYQNKDESYERIQQTLTDAGIDFHFNTTFTDLMIHDGEVVGATATTAAGEKLTINAKAVVVATGGYGGDREKVARTMHTTNLRTLGVPNNGEGLTAMVKAGGTDIDSHALIHAAQLAKSTVTQKTSHQHLAGFSGNPLTQLLLTPQLWVNMTGQRFANEDVVYDTVEWANAAWSQGGKYFFIVDQATLDKFTADQNSEEVSQAGPGAATGQGDFTALAEEAVAGQTAFKGTTLTELAQNAGMDPDTFKQTVTSYNQAVTTKNDTEFSKRSQSLAYSIVDGPFYAFVSQAAYLGTVGGVRVDRNLAVLDDHFKPIPGLYTGGANAGGYYEGHSYPAFEGLASGFTWTSGRIAGTSAAVYAKAKLAATH